MVERRKLASDTVAFYWPHRDCGNHYATEVSRPDIRLEFAKAAGEAVQRDDPAEAHDRKLAARAGTQLERVAARRAVQIG